jgi:hypothetical protein
MPGLEKRRKIHKVGDSEMISLPSSWRDFWKEKEDILDKSKNNRGEVDIYVNSLLVVVPRQAKNYEELKERARKIVEGHEPEDMKKGRNK